VSNFEQITNTKKGMWILGRRGTAEGAMSKADEFWQYAKEAILSACDAKTDTDKEGLLELARTWTQAALRERASVNRQTG
jgi:hypothetical protein